MTDKLTCMDTILQGVFLVGTRMGETYNFMTAAFVTQVSFHPCAIALSVQNTHYTARLIKEQGQFSLSVLSEDQKREAQVCGYQSGRETDKSKRVQFHLTKQGLPVLEGAASYMLCRVMETIEFEDHTIFLAEIEDGETTKKRPLAYVSKDFFP